MPCPANELGTIVPFVTMQKFKGETFVARALLDGKGTGAARSGTACRAPTEQQKRRTQRSRGFLATAPACT